MQNQTNKIRDSVEDRQSRIAWQTVNEESRKKSTAKTKLIYLPANKNEYTYGNSISRNYSETLRKLHMNQSRKW